MAVDSASRQRAWLINRSGSIDALQLTQAPIPVPGPGEVRIEIDAVGLNPHDVRFLTATDPEARWPRIPGVDVAGRIEALGPGVTGWRIGTRVSCLLDPARGGGFADFALAPALALAPIPAAVGHVDAAALPSAGFAAFHAIELRLAPKPGASILIYGAGGGVGGYAVQLARARDLIVLATYSGHDRDYVHGLGAREAIDWRADDLPAIVRSLTDGRGVDAIVDVVGRAHATEALELLRPDGGLACTAGLPSLTGRAPHRGAIAIHEIAPGAVYRRDDEDGLRQLAMTGRALLKRLSNGNLRSLVSEIVAFEAIPSALKRLMAGEIRGKAVARLRA